MDSKIITIFNKLFISLKKYKIESFEDLSNQKILYEIGLEIDNKLFSQIETTITGEDNLVIKIAEFTEISEIFLNMLKPPKFIAKKKYKEEIELIDVIGLANKEPKNIYNFLILIIISIFFCENNSYFISKIKDLEKDEKSFIYDLVQTYGNLPEIEGQKNKKDTNHQKIQNLEKDYNNIKNQFSDLESKNSLLMKELNEIKTKNKELEKIIDEKNKKIEILQNKLDEKIKLIKERDTQLNKEIENYMELNYKLNEIKNVPINDYEKKYKEELELNETLKDENLQLNELINVMKVKLTEKSKDNIEGNENNIRDINELEKKLKECEKEKEKFKIEKDNLKMHFDKEFELMSSVIYNLGFQFWSLKCEDSEKLKQNENWLVKERIKQYNGDY